MSNLYNYEVWVRKTEVLEGTVEASNEEAACMKARRAAVAGIERPVIEKTVVRLAPPQWRLALAIKGGHRYFTDITTGRVAVADDSGETPDQTEDGILWLDYTRCVAIGEQFASIPVIVERDGSSSQTGERPREALRVALCFKMKVHAEESILAFASDLLKAVKET